MRLAEIADRLQRLLPGQTDLLSDQLAITSISATGTTATVVTAGPHRLETGYVVTLSGVEQRTPITAVSSDGFLHTFTTSVDHDLTEGNPDTETVLLEGFTDDAWNTNHELVNVPNRRTFTVRSTVAAPTLSGNDILLEPSRIDGVNGQFEVTVQSRTSFTIAGSFLAGTYTPINGRVSAMPRIGVAVDGPRALEIFNEDPDQFWAFVMPNQAVVSKDRATFSDAVSTKGTGTSFRLRLLDNFSVAVFAPVSDELAAEEALDICRHDLLGPIVSALFGYKPTTGLSCPTSEFGIVFSGHGVEDYDKAVLAYVYDFQAVIDLSSEDSAIADAGNRAFRDADYAQTNVHEPLTAAIDLDDQPLG